MAALALEEAYKLEQEYIGDNEDSIEEYIIIEVTKEEAQSIKVSSDEKEEQNLTLWEIFEKDNAKYGDMSYVICSTLY